MRNSHLIAVFVGIFAGETSVIAQTFGSGDAVNTILRSQTQPADGQVIVGLNVSPVQPKKTLNKDRFGRPLPMKDGKPVKGGVLVVSVLKGSPAHRAGFNVGDIVMSVDGTPIDSVGTWDAAWKSFAAKKPPTNSCEVAGYTYARNRWRFGTAMITPRRGAQDPISTTPGIEPDTPAKLAVVRSVPPGSNGKLGYYPESKASTIHVCLDEASWKEVINRKNAVADGGPDKSNAVLVRLILAGKFKEFKVGTRVRVIEYLALPTAEFMPSAKVQVLDGENKGQVGWIFSENVLAP
jgi:membrane-associated protease RseP (regulator of RpoE activity)